MKNSGEQNLCIKVVDQSFEQKLRTKANGVNKSWDCAVASSAQFKLAGYNLMAMLLILTQLADANTVYCTQISCIAKLQLKNKFKQVGGGWVVGWGCWRDEE